MADVTILGRVPPVEVDVAGRRFRLVLAEAGLACCAVEVAAALSRADAADVDAADVGAADEQPPSRVLDVLVVSGTVTDVLAPAVRALWAALPAPGYVVSFGACSDSGGPYWDSYSVTPGVDRLIPVDVYVPGCPPRPDALLDGLTLLAERAGP